MTTDLFKVGSVDYTSHIVDGTYKVNSIKKYVEWSDGFGATHRDQRQAKVEGSLDLFFKTASEYQTFLSDLENAKYNAEYQYNIFVKPNNSAPTTAKNIHAFIDFTPTRELSGTWRDRYKTITIDIKES